MRLFWFLQVGPKFNHICPWRGRGKFHTHTHTHTHTHVNRKVETAAKQPQVKECQQPPEAGRVKETHSPLEAPQTP